MQRDGKVCQKLSEARDHGSVNKQMLDDLAKFSQNFFSGGSIDGDVCQAPCADNCWMDALELVSSDHLVLRKSILVDSLISKIAMRSSNPTSRFPTRRAGLQPNARILGRGQVLRRGRRPRHHPIRGGGSDGGGRARGRSRRPARRRSRGKKNGRPGRGREESQLASGVATSCVATKSGTPIVTVR